MIKCDPKDFLMDMIIVCGKKNEELTDKEESEDLPPMPPLEG